ncbi:MAG: carbonic anhydrase family protein [Chromatiaceae bacterium]
MNQSPIDVGSTVHADLAPVAIDYAGHGTNILNNGHTVQVNVQAGGTLTMDGRTFTLKQFHFHAPSEHTVAGKSYALEAHFVHADPEGHLAVIGVLLSEGEPNADLAKLWAAMPTEVGAAKPLTIPVNPASLLPANRDYFRYNGSLTTPPCTEGVRWLVMKEPLSVSKEQVFELIQVLHGFKNRPVQPVNARPVLR